jgi:crotonobetainyl-CoA:carnitine CoA-transferase CaiB-like acyl-CoA transferase
MLLQGHIVVALNDAAESALARFLVSLGATLARTSNDTLLKDCAHADFLLDQIGTQTLAKNGITRAQLEAINPRLIHVSVTTFGSTGPRANWRGSELLASAMGGVLRLTGEPDRAPVKEALDACGFHADMVAASGALTALYERERSGLGQHVDVSSQEVAFSRNVNSILVWQFDRRKLQRAGGALNYGRVTVRCIWPLADGYCFHSLMTGRFGAPANQALSDWMDEVGADNPLRGVDWLRYNRSTLDATTRGIWERAIESFFRTRTRDEVKHDGRRRGINATVLATPEDVLNDPHLAARGFWSDDDTSEFRPHPNPPPATRRGDTSDPLPCDSGGGRGCGHPSRFVAITNGATPSNLQTPRANTTSRKGPLSGVRVLDFSWALVGSITTKVLGDLGADVIKVESRTRPCLSRIDVQVSQSRADSFDDKPWFAHLNSSKLSLALDMKHAANREVLDPLIQWADVVVENFSPGTMQKLGLDYEQLKTRKPNIVMVSGSVFGQTGPLAQEWGVDGTGAALSSRTLLSGWPDRGPAISSAVPYGDVIVPYVMAAAVAAALAQRFRSGRGCHIDASMYEICVQQMSTAIAASARGESVQRQGNRDSRVFHQGVYSAQGSDRWVAITLFTQRDWQKLVEHARLGTAKTPDERDAFLQDWLQTKVDTDVVEQLQSLGIAAGTVQDIEDMMENDAQLQARGALMSLPHPLLGAFGHVRTPIAFSRSEVTPFQAPGIGEHNHHIATTVCGLSKERVGELVSLELFK